MGAIGQTKRAVKAEKLLDESELKVHASFVGCQLLLEIFGQEYLIINELLQDYSTDQEKAFQQALKDRHYSVEYWQQVAAETVMYLFSDLRWHVKAQDGQTLKSMYNLDHDQRLMSFDGELGKLDPESSLGKKVSEWEKDYREWRKKQSMAKKTESEQLP